MPESGHFRFGAPRCKHSAEYHSSHLVEAVTEPHQDWMNNIISKLASAAQFLLDIGQYDEAISCFKTLSEGDDTYENGDYAFGIARAYEGKGELEAVLEWYQIAQENNPPVLHFSDGIRRVEGQLQRFKKKRLEDEDQEPTKE